MKNYCSNGSLALTVLLGGYYMVLFSTPAWALAASHVGNAIQAQLEAEWLAEDLRFGFRQFTATAAHDAMGAARNSVAFQVGVVGQVGQ